MPLILAARIRVAHSIPKSVAVCRTLAIKVFENCIVFHLLMTHDFFLQDIAVVSIRLGRRWYWLHQLWRPLPIGRIKVLVAGRLHERIGPLRLQEGM